MRDFSQLATEESIEITVKALTANGFRVLVAENSNEARELALSLIPQGAEIMTATSKTLSTLGLDEKLNTDKKYDSIKPKLAKLNRTTESLAMQKLGAAAEYMIGSVHAVTEDGKVLIASRSGSQLPGYAYGSSHVIWVVSTKKIVKNIEEGMERIYKYVLPLESERVKEAYGMSQSEVRKLLVMNAEEPGRITIILVKVALGF